MAGMAKRGTHSARRRTGRSRSDDLGSDVPESDWDGQGFADPNSGSAVRPSPQGYYPAEPYPPDGYQPGPFQPEADRSEAHLGEPGPYEAAREPSPFESPRYQPEP